MKKRNLAVIIGIAASIMSVVVSAGKVQASEEETNNTLIFGHYEQDGDLLNGPEGIEWLIVDETDTSLMLVSRYPLEYMPFNDSKGDITWKDSSIRKWLNSTFLDMAFYSDELAVIRETDIDNSSKQHYESNKWVADGGKNTKDRVFLLSYAEAEKYLPDDKVELNEYVVGQGAKLLFLDDSTWWLRSPGKKQSEACYMGNGSPSSISATADSCVRPVIWINDAEFDWDNDVLSRSLDAYDLAEQGKYEEAVAIVDQLGDYWGSQIDAINYRMEAGKASMESGNYDEAMTWLSGANDFIDERFEGEDSTFLKETYDISGQLVECKYQKAITVMNSGDIDTAIEMFTDIGQYKESMDYICSTYNITCKGHKLFFKYDYSGVREPPVRRRQSHSSGLTEPATLCRERLFT